MIARRIRKVLAHAEIFFRGQDGIVPQRELDLFEWHAPLMGELGESATGIMRRESQAELARALGDNQVHALGGKPAAGQAVCLVDRAKQPSFRDTRSFGPAVERRFGPGGDGDGADALALADQIDDRPAALPLLDVPEIESGELLAAQPRSKQQAQNGEYSFPGARLSNLG